MRQDSKRTAGRRKLLITLGVALGVSAVVGAGTFATFNAQVSNPSNVFSTGTLVLSDKVGSGTACLSTGGGSTDTNANSACDTLFNLTVKKPGDNGSANITVKNEGSLAASALSMFAGSCADANAAGETYHGTGSACGKVDVYVQQYSDSGFTTPSTCLYGGGNATTCSFDDAKTLTTFASAYSSSGSALGLGGLASGSSDYVKVAVQLPSGAANSYQGRSATVDFTFYAQQ